MPICLSDYLSVCVCVYTCLYTISEAFGFLEGPCYVACSIPSATMLLKTCSHLRAASLYVGKSKEVTRHDNAIPEHRTTWQFIFSGAATRLRSEPNTPGAESAVSEIAAAIEAAALEVAVQLAQKQRELNRRRREAALAAKTALVEQMKASIAEIDTEILVCHYRSVVIPKKSNAQEAIGQWHRKCACIMLRNAAACQDAAIGDSQLANANMLLACLCNGAVRCVCVCV